MYVIVTKFVPLVRSARWYAGRYTAQVGVLSIRGEIVYLNIASFTTNLSCVYVLWEKFQRDMRHALCFASSHFRNTMCIEEDEAFPRIRVFGTQSLSSTATTNDTTACFCSDCSPNESFSVLCVHGEGF